MARKQYYADWQWIDRAAKEILDDRKILNQKNVNAPDSVWMKQQLILRITRAINDIELINLGGGAYGVNRIQDEAPKWYEEQERKRNDEIDGSPQTPLR